MNKPVFFRRPFKYSYFNVTLILIFINVAVFFLTYFNRSLQYSLSLNVYYVLHYKMFWQFFTYMFVHAGLTHLFFNMFGLLIFGIAVERVIGSKEFLLFYLLCGVISGAFSFLVYLLTGSVRVVLMGASGAIYSVLFAYAVCYPNSRVFIWGILPIRSPVLVMIYTIIEIVEQLFTYSNVAHLTHLFGFVAAFLYFVIRMGINPIKVWKGVLKKDKPNREQSEDNEEE